MESMGPMGPYGPGTKTGDGGPKIESFGCRKEFGHEKQKLGWGTKNQMLVPVGQQMNFWSGKTTNEILAR